jgi:glycosyltransferase involved in cell wall biosynthesis
MILLIYTNFGSFVRTDYDILRQKWDIKRYQYQMSKSLVRHIIEQLQLLLWLLIHIWRAKTVFIWFADYHSFLPVLFARTLHKKSFLVLGGYDVTYIPELDYGSLKNPIRAFCSKFSIRHATLNLPDSDTLAEEASALVPKARIKTLYTGFDETRFYPSGKKKENYILTVAAGDDIQRIKLKGLDIFIEVAKKLPQYKFAIIGGSSGIRDYLKEIPINVSILGKVSDAVLLESYQKAQLYLQLSMREGLPSAVCEAMLCECIPIGFNNGGIPIAIGDCGYVLLNNTVDNVVKTIHNMNRDTGTLGKKARDRVITHFSYSIREKKIHEIIMA